MITEKLARVAALIVIFGASAIAQCVPPHYRDGKVLENSRTSVMMHISVKTEDLSPDRLICLAQALKQRFRSRSDISISIFTSDDAAKNFVPMGSEWTPEGVKRAAALHAQYVFSASQGKHYIVLIPDALDPNEQLIDTKIDLPSTGKPCDRLEINNRCLMAFQHIQYPGDALRRMISGEIELAGTITPDGKLAKVVVVNSGEDDPVLAAAAADNLKTWRFEPAKEADRIDITFSYGIVSEPKFTYGSNFEFNLPHQVTIKGNPIH